MMRERMKDEGMKKELKEEKKIKKEGNEKENQTPFFKRQYIMHRFPPLFGLEPIALDSQP